MEKKSYVTHPSVRTPIITDVINKFPGDGSYETLPCSSRHTASWCSSSHSIAVNLGEMLARLLVNSRRRATGVTLIDGLVGSVVSRVVLAVRREPAVPIWRLVNRPVQDIEARGCSQYGVVVVMRVVGPNR